MAAENGRGTVAVMAPHAITTELMRLVPHVYRATRAATDDEDAAADVVERVLRAATRERLLGRLQPQRPPVEALDEADAGAGEDRAEERGHERGIEVDEVKRSMLRGLRKAVRVVPACG